MVDGRLLLIIVVIFLELFWITQLVNLMGRKDSSFPGKYDKIIWAAIFLMANVLGAFVYLIIRMKEDAKQLTEIDKPVKEYPEPCIKCGKIIPVYSKKCLNCGLKDRK